MSIQGANSKYMYDLLKRIFERSIPEAKNFNDLFMASIRKSFILSADLAHAISPNYGEYH